MNSTEKLNLDETVLDAMRRVTEKQECDAVLTGTEHLASVAMVIVGMCVAVNRVESSLDSPAVRKQIQENILKWIEEGTVPDEQAFMLESFANSLHKPKELTDWRDDFREMFSGVKKGGAGSARAAKTYIVRHPVSQLIKIGKSFDPDKRIRTLSTQSGAILKTLLIIDSDVECELHRKFSEFRVHGEWFNDQKGLIAEYVNTAKECDQ